MKRILYVLFAISLLGCQRELGVDLPYEGDRLVIFGLISADSTVAVRIQKTGPPTGRFLFSESIVANAAVRLFENGVLVEQLRHTSTGNYLSPSGFKPKVGKGYSLKVSAPGLPDADTGSEVIPSVVKVDSYVFRDTVTSPFTQDEARKLTFSFTDDAREANFYAAQIIGQYRGNFVALNTFYIGRPLEVSEDLCSFLADDNQYVLQDVCFNGMPFSADLGISTNGNLQDTTGTGKSRGQQVDCDQILLRFRKVTRTYRDYLRLSGFDEEGFLRAFALPTREFTNVTGGYGLWAAYSEDEIDILK